MPETLQPDPELRARINRLGGYAALAERFGLSPRTAERIFSGAKPCPPTLREEILQAEAPHG